jgi:hypothetical protein
MAVDFDGRSNLIITQKFVSVQAGGTHYKHFDFNVHLCVGYSVYSNRRAVPKL